ncbi:hypothetical protein BGX28_000842 [Mortierella sp. GBA30]|nr:hypothetical protein BGX28_000842 [Mortierella sp. GBA30]
MNANDPVMDYTQLIKPTATVSSFPPIPIPAVVSLDLSQEKYLEGEETTTTYYSYSVKTSKKSSNNNNNRRSFFTIYWPYRKGKGTEVKASTTASSSRSKEQDKPRRSTYSPPASYSVQDYEEHSLRQTTAFNKSGFCDKIAPSQPESQELYRDYPTTELQHDWKAHLPVALPNKP